MSLLQLNPQDFIAYLKQNNLNRFSIIFDESSNLVKISDPKLQEIADFINADKRDFMKHEGMFFQVSSEYDILQSAFIHQTNRGQASGGLRYWNYETIEDLLRDGMRLSKGMTRKNALANLWWGGGKGIMVHNPNYDKNDTKLRKNIYQDYGRFISSIKGCYITAEDVGTSEEDMAEIFSQTRFTTCIPAALGGSGNPSSATALGVVKGMEAALDFLNLGSIEGKIIAVQGMGHVAEPMINYLFERNAQKVIAADIDDDLVNRIKNKYTNKNFEGRLVDIEDKSILFADCDILAPCATGAILNKHTIPQIKAKIICGAANNQLSNSQTDGHLLKNKGITYVPDFLVNRMGIVNCAGEQAGYIDEDPLFNQHLEKEYEFGVFQTALRVLKQAKDSNQTPADVAIELADAKALENNPIYGHRGKKIIASLASNNWHH